MCALGCTTARASVNIDAVLEGLTGHLPAALLPVRGLLLRDGTKYGLPDIGGCRGDANGHGNREDGGGCGQHWPRDGLEPSRREARDRQGQQHGRSSERTGHLVQRKQSLEMQQVSNRARSS